MNKISFYDFIDALKIWREGKSMSPSGRHLGHCKCLFMNNNRKMTTTYYWRLCGQEDSYGMCMVNNGKLNDRQAGSRPGRNAINIAIQKEMKYLYSRATRTGIGTMDNEAKSCYDRIICNLAMIISQYYGVSSKIAETRGKTLQKMRYRLHAALRDSKVSYEHTETTWVHGTGQGNCASPSIWLLIESGMKNVWMLMHKGVHGTGQGSCTSPSLWLLISSILMDCLS
jgi:hypothetical protein